MYKVLIIDDDEQIRRSLQRHLHKAGYQVEEAIDGLDGLAKVTSFDPELILLDIMMPGMNGYEVCQNIRIGQKRDHYVLMLSAKGSAQDIVLGLDVGADDYMAKPFDPNELLARIRAALRRWESRSQLGAVELKKKTRQGMMPIEVLLVSEDDLAAQVMHKVLDKLGGYLVTHVPRPKEALELLKQEHKFRLLIAEERGQINRNQLILTWRTDPDLMQLPLILVTEQPTFEKIKMIREFAIRYVVVKPLEEESFYQKLSKAVKLKGRYTPELIDRLRDLPFLGEFAPQHLNELLGLGYLKAFQDGECLVEERQVVNKFGLLVQGRVRVQKQTEQGLKEVASLEAGNLIGETTLFNPSPASVRLVAQGECLAFLLPYFAFPLLDTVIREQLFKLVITELGNKLHQTTSKG